MRADIAIFGWIPAVLVLFSMLPPRRALLISLIGGWLFLPLVSYKIPGFPEIDKVFVACVGALLGTLVFDLGAYLRLRLRWYDVPWLVWCLVPAASSLANHLGAWDAMSSAVRQTVIWGIPYLLGRVYFNDSRSARALAKAVFVGGLIYVPFCLLEVRMSPVLRFWVYGAEVNNWWDGALIRFGGWRPVVFMFSGLAVGMWMTAASVLGVWLWASGLKTGPWRVAMGTWVTLLLITTVLCKSLGSLVLLVVGLLVLFVTRELRSPVLAAVLVLLAPAYILSRSVGGWSGSQLLTWSSEISKDRASSLDTRLRNENVLVERASERPIFGWGGWGRNRIVDQDTGQDRSITDGMWVIALGSYGWLGLGSYVAALLVGPLILLWRCAGRGWSDPARAGLVAMGVVLPLCAIDSLFNAMVNPIFSLMAGAVASMALSAELSASCPQMGSAFGAMRRPVPREAGGAALPTMD